MAEDNNNLLFSEDVLSEVEASSIRSKVKNGPVTVLGHTFDNDEERRAYFRKELRKKLPELKRIEGYPLGDDEDIITLSDPPYFTACPNPWLNDFVVEWEKEKKQLAAEGKRKEEKKVSEPYAYGITQGKNSAIYNAHTYHTKVPHQVIMRYILHYTQPGDIVLDGFAGTGMAGVAASVCGNPDPESRNEIEKDFKENGFAKPIWGKRRGVCGDLSPLCFHISSNYNSTVNALSLQKAVNEIVAKLKDRFGHFYEIPSRWGPAHVNYFVWSEVVLCKNCGEELNVHDLSYDYARGILYKNLKCPKCGTEQSKSDAQKVLNTSFDEVSKSTVSEIRYDCCLMNLSTQKSGRQFSREIPNPKFPPFEGFIPVLDIPTEGDEIPRLHKVGCDKVNQIYHKRTQYVLAYLYELIHTQYIEFEKPLMFIFTSMLPKLTRLNRYMPQHGSRALVGPMANTLYIPPQGVENNPIDQFQYQAGKVIRAMEFCEEGSVVQTASATNSQLPNNSVDYIFTDPPFGANIMYSELNTISESWLRVMTNNEEEAISNETQHKGLFEYQEIMTRCFKEYNRVLKPGHWMTVEFSNTSAAFWNSLQHSIKSAGFIIAAITDLNKERGGLHAMIGPVAVKQDLAISCYKPSDELEEKISEQPSQSLWEMVDEHLSHVAKFIKNEKGLVFIAERDPRIIYDRVISYYVQKGLDIPIDSTSFQAELRERFIERDGMFFSAADVAIYDENKKYAPEMVPMGLIVSSEVEGIEWLKNRLRDKPQTYQDIHPDWMQAITATRKGDIVPELSEILSENFIQEDNGTWRLPNIQDDVDKDKLREKALLKEFKIYVEAASKPHARIKEVRVEAIRCGFKKCYMDKDFATIVMVGDKIPQNLLTEDDILLQFYDIARTRI